MKQQKQPEIDYLAELVGEFIEYWGFKKIHGKIWLHLYLGQEPLDASALMQKLKVSKALISISLRDLLEYEVILEKGLGPEGTRLYEANEDLNRVISQVLRQREKIMMGKIQAAFGQLKELPVEDLLKNKIKAQRIQNLDKLIKNGEKGLNTIMAIL